MKFDLKVAGGWERRGGTSMPAGWKRTWNLRRKSLFLSRKATECCGSSYFCRASELPWRRNANLAEASFERARNSTHMPELATFISCFVSTHLAACVFVTAVAATTTTATPSRKDGDKWKQLMGGTHFLKSFPSCLRH